MRKIVKSKRVVIRQHMCCNSIVGMFFFFNMCILLSEKPILFGSQPHYNPVKDLKIHASNMFVIWRWNEKKTVICYDSVEIKKHVHVSIWEEIP